LCLGSYRDDEISPRARAGVEYVASEVAGTLARITAEESLRQSEAKLRTTITNAPVALLSCDPQGTITFEEGKAISGMGASPGEHVGQSALTLYRDFPLMQENMRRALNGETFSSVVEFTPVTFECQFCPVSTEGGQASGFIVVGTDVTERVRLEREVLEITDREQARIGQDIHDGLCQQLIGMAFSANALLQSLNSHGRPEAATASRITTLLDEAITESRRVCRGLYPIRLSTDGLGVALQDLAATTSERHNIRCECHTDVEDNRYEMAIATHLYRIAQEAVNNAVKHARGSDITITLTNSKSATTLEVRDFGRGSDLPPGPGSGMGLHIMSYRARLLGGNLAFKKNATGATVLCSMPKV
jgi:PAS domain S-box-containing protein